MMRTPAHRVLFKESKALDSFSINEFDNNSQLCYIFMEEKIIYNFLQK